MEPRRQGITEEKAFYQDLDHQARGSCCTCPTLILLFTGLLAILAISTYLIFTRLTKLRLPKKSPQILTPAYKESAGNQIALTDRELQTIIWSGPQMLVPLKNKQAVTTADGIVLSGQLIALSDTPVKIILQPVVKDNKIIFTNAALASGPVAFGNEFLTPLTNKSAELLNTALTRKTSQPIKDIKTENGRLIIGL